MISIAQKTDHEIAPCLSAGPLAEAGRRFISAAERLPNAPFAAALKTWCVPYLFRTMENLLADGREPFSGVNRALDGLAAFLDGAGGSGFEVLGGALEETTAENNGNGADVKKITGEHYGNLFRSFSDRSYWDEPVRLLRQRLERNGISVGGIEGKKLLDAGCGGGRYTVAWRLLGAAPVVGADISPINIEDAGRRIREADIDQITFRQGNVLELPFDDEEFDIVFSNGVLHHTTDWEQGVREMLRVMKPGGMGWLYLIENPGGMFWDVIEILRLLMKDVPKSAARRALRAIGQPANRIFYMLDHVMVPINLRLTPGEIEDCLKKAGAVRTRRLERGADFDRVEHIHRRTPFAEEHFGVGENRYVFSK
jgi:ubiquinone/menaquinone biosynthesis C-methylase UbiE